MEKEQRPVLHLWCKTTVLLACLDPFSYFWIAFHSLPATKDSLDAWQSFMEKQIPHPAPEFYNQQGKSAVNLDKY